MCKFWLKITVVNFSCTVNTDLNRCSKMLSIFVSGGIVAHVQAIVRGTALLPCDLTASASNDTVVLVVWYKDEHSPIYRYTVCNI